jgi:hypothetical protein
MPISPSPHQAATAFAILILWDAIDLYQGSACRAADNDLREFSGYAMRSRASFIRPQRPRALRGLVGTLALAFAVSVFVLASGETEQACPPAKEASSIASTTQKTAPVQKKIASQPVVEMASAMLRVDATGHGCCGNLLPGPNCKSFSCSMCCFVLPATAATYRPGMVVSICGVPDDLGLILGQPKADFRPPRLVA